MIAKRIADGISPWQRPPIQDGLAALRTDPAWAAEADLIERQRHLSDCQRNARLARLVDRWRAWKQAACTALAALLLAACTALADPVQGRCPVIVSPDIAPANAMQARRTAAMLVAVGARAAERFPGLSREAADKGYTIVVADRILDAVGAQGLHDGGRKTIYVHPKCGADLNRLRYVFAHEIGHAIYTNMPIPDREAYLSEYQAERDAGRLPDTNAEELFADLVARIGLGLMVDKLPATQRYIRGRLCQ
jgi:hypothetical protein